MRLLTIMLVLLLAACGDDNSGLMYSLEFGHETDHQDYCAPLSLPADFGSGLLFSIWTRIPNDLSNPILNTLNRGNMIVCNITGTNWNLVCLVGNIYVFGDGMGGYNANYMLGFADLWAGDYCTYQTLEMDRMPLPLLGGWVWVAWQVVLNADHSFTFRQWLKFGREGQVFRAGHWMDSPTGEETVSTEYLRAFVTDTPHADDSLHNWGLSLPHNGGRTMDAAAAASWLPGRFASLQIGWDNTYSGINTPPNSFLTRAHLYARTNAPSLQELENIAGSTLPDPAAWGDWPLSWDLDDAILADQSGNMHHLTLQPGGKLYRGPVAP